MNCRMLTGELCKHGLERLARRERVDERLLRKLKPVEQTVRRVVLKSGKLKHACEGSKLNETVRRQTPCQQHVAHRVLRPHESNRSKVAQQKIRPNQRTFRASAARPKVTGLGCKVGGHLGDF